MPSSSSAGGTDDLVGDALRHDDRGHRRLGVAAEATGPCLAHLEHEPGGQRLRGTLGVTDPHEAYGVAAAQAGRVLPRRQGYADLRLVDLERRVLAQEIRLQQLAGVDGLPGVELVDDLVGLVHRDRAEPVTGDVART